MTPEINNVEEFINRIFEKKEPSSDTTLFYRGHADRVNFHLEPSLFRKQPKERQPPRFAYLEKEHIMFRELIASNPGDFHGDASTFEKLVRMQHHSLPTRLLDITSNPLMALYFAVCEFPDDPAEVIVFSVKKSEIFFYDSDTTSVIASLSRLELNAKDQIAALASQPNMDVTVFNSDTNRQVQRLLHAIREEKPYFLPLIRPCDISRIICVKSKMSNSRIASQAGSFLLFGHIQTQDDSCASGILSDALCASGIQSDTIEINRDAKKKIIEELDALNINEATVYPYIENSAKYIKKKYGH